MHISKSFFQEWNWISFFSLVYWSRRLRFASKDFWQFGCRLKKFPPSCPQNISGIKQSLHKLTLINVPLLKELICRLRWEPHIQFGTVNLFSFFSLTKFSQTFQGPIRRIGRILKWTFQKAPDAIKQTIRHSNTWNVLDHKFHMKATQKPDPTTKTKCAFMTNSNRLMFFRKLIAFNWKINK